MKAAVVMGVLAVGALVFVAALATFSRASVVEQILVRIDDKLSRLARGTQTEAVPEDTVRDLIGYLVILRVAQRDGGK